MPVPGLAAVFCYSLIVFLAPELVHAAEGVWIGFPELIPQQEIFHFFVNGEMIVVLVGCYRLIYEKSSFADLQ